MGSLDMSRNQNGISIRFSNQTNIFLLSRLPELSSSRPSPPWASHIEKLKDVVELDLTINPAYEAKRKDAVGDGMYQDKLVSRSFLYLCVLILPIIASGTNAQ